MIAIYGKGKVGHGLEKLCIRQNISYQLIDDSDAPHDFSQYEYIVVSPGIPPSHTVYHSGVPCVCELDFASRFLPEKRKIIAVTGTDGKSTTAWILYQILHAHFGERVSLGGNFGTPLSQMIVESQDTYHKGATIFIVEVSSFMAHSMKEFQPDYTIFTNFMPDHQDWHESIDDYFLSKWNLIEATKQSAIVHYKAIEMAIKLGKTIDTNVVESFLGPQDNSRVKGLLIFQKGKPQFTLEGFPLKGPHNAANVCSAAYILKKLIISIKHVEMYLPRIFPLPHRIETIATIKSVDYVEDSKGTSSQAMLAAVESFEKNIIIIVGGADKGERFENVIEAWKKRVKLVITLGSTMRPIFESRAQEAGVPNLPADTMHDAVSLASSHACAGDTVLLSPGCSSFDMFHDYLDRANQFRDAVKNLSLSV